MNPKDKKKVEEIIQVSSSQEIEQNNDNNNNILPLVKNDILIKEINDNPEKEENNIEKIQEDIEIIPNISEKKNTNKESNSEEENGIKIPKTVSIDEFNKKIDSALEQEQKDNLIQENSESNLDEKTEKEKDDPKYNEIKQILGSEICDLFSSQKWENKKHALELINSLINEKEVIYNPNDLFNYIKIKMKNFKETNFNIIKEALNIFISLLKKRNLSKENFLLLINFYYEKISDIKLKDNFIELINTAIEESIINAGDIIYNLISKISKKKNVKILNEYSTLFIKLIEENDIKDLPISDIVKYCKLMAGNSNPQVRTSATNLICVLYKYMGEDLKPLLKDIKESTLKMIEAELEKVIIVDKKETNKNPRKIIKKNSKTDNNIIINGESNQITPIDISKKINPHLKDLSEGKWSEKKEAVENIENILLEANNKILPLGLNDFFNLIKSKLSDGNKNYVKMLISLLNKFISALKKEFKPWTKMIALSLIPNLSDKNQSIRNECQQCFETWVNNIGIDSLVIYFPQFLKNENVEIRIEIMKFIKKYKEYFSKSLAENIYKELIDGLLLCLQDRANNVRNEAEDVIILSLDYIDIDNYYKKIKDFKPVIEKDLKQILENITLQRYENNKHEEENELNTYIIKLNKEASPYKQFNENDNLELNIKDINEKNNALNSSNIKRKRNITKTAEKEKYKKTNSKLIEKKESMNLNPDNKTSGTLASNSTVLRSHKNINNSLEKRLKINRKNTSNKNVIKIQIFNLNNNTKIPINKNRRLELDKKFKFSIDTISQDDINKLKEYAKIIFIDDFSTKIFENNLNKEIDFFNKMKSYLEAKEDLYIFFDNMDIILKIISLKINNNYNPSLLKHFFMLLNTIYLIISEAEYHLDEIEANIILCLLTDKISINNNQIRDISINLIRQYSQIIDMNKSFLEVLNFALNKNNKVKSKILDMALEFHLKKKIIMTSKTYVKVLSKYLLLNDNIIKPKCFKIFKQLQEYIKEEILNSKDFGDKEKNIIENNIMNSDDEDFFDNGEEYNEEEENNEENEMMDEDNIDDNDDIDNNDNEKYNANDKNLNKFYLSEERYQNLNLNKEDFDNNNINNNNNSEFTNEENLENENIPNLIEKKSSKSNNMYYMKTDNKLEDKQNKSNIKKQPIYYKNTEIIEKIQKINSMKNNNFINDNTDIKPKITSNKFSLPKKIIVKQ